MEFFCQHIFLFSKKKMCITFNLSLEWVTHIANGAEERWQTEYLTLFSDVTVVTSGRFVNYLVESPG